MKALSAVVHAFLVGLAASVARADSFGSGANQFTIDFVAIGDPGNTADASGEPNPAGAVGYLYRMGAYEVSEDMVTKADALGALGITTDSRAPHKPATSVTWNEAARFVNWLNTSSGHAAAYRFAFQPGDAGYDADANIELWQAWDVGYDPANPYRNSKAVYVLPTTDEWYKSAYYDPAKSGGAGGYWNYATGSDAPPAITYGGTVPGTAVYGQWPNPVSPADITLAGGLSPYGTMGQTGNVYEWNESPIDEGAYAPGALRGVRGGNWSLDSHYAVAMSSSVRQAIEPTFVSAGFGFRVAAVSGASSVPEIDPKGLGSVLAFVLGALGMLERRPLRGAAGGGEIA